MGELPSDRHDLVFYDGSCALCHATVRFAVRHDPEGDRFAFAPLGGTTWDELLGDRFVTRVPDSVVVRTADGAVLVRSAAVLRLLRRCGGVWSATAHGLALLPAGLMDLAYSLVARTRRRLFGEPADACPVPPGPLRGRFVP